MKHSLFSQADYGKENRKTRPTPKRDKHVIKIKKIYKKCRLCREEGVRVVHEVSSLGNQEFLLCKQHYEEHERKHMKFKPFFEKASEIN